MAFIFPSPWDQLPVQGATFFLLFLGGGWTVSHSSRRLRLSHASESCLKNGAALAAYALMLIDHIIFGGGRGRGKLKPRITRRGRNSAKGKGEFGKFVRNGTGVPESSPEEEKLEATKSWWTRHDDSGSVVDSFNLMAQTGYSSMM